MPTRVGFVSAAHLHIWSYHHAFTRAEGIEMVGIFDSDAERGNAFAAKTGLPAFESLELLLENVDAVIIASENRHHAAHISAAARANKHFICEKPIATTRVEITQIESALQGFEKVGMTAFPCRFAPAYQSLKKKVQAGNIGQIRGATTTNRGTCPFSWFTQPDLSGGGAMIDHVVHVTDLLLDLFGSPVESVQAQIGNQMYQQEWDDTAMVTLNFANGVFASLDSSWTRLPSYKTWGDVTMTLVGDKGVLELDLFGHDLDIYRAGEPSHSVIGVGSDFDALLIQEFLDAIRDGKRPTVTVQDGLRASEVAIAAYESVRSGQVAKIAA